MREIKFRAWIRREQKMFFVLQLEWNTDRPDEWHSIHLYPLRIIQAKDFEINGLELMQFTGLRDKNGTEIYEGDMLKVEEMAISEDAAQKQLRGADVVQGTITGFVEWDSEGCDYNLVCNSEDEVIGIPRHRQIYEVIGNIHENPELLK